MRPDSGDLIGKDDKARQAKYIDTLTRDTAHAFNNVLNSILMSTKLLQTGRPEHEQQHLFQVLEASAQRGAEVVKRLLAARAL
jgi:two-component system, cell cycle sensor histidine kinase and response regulator CckA